jgi:arsenite methyltransferase
MDSTGTDGFDRNVGTDGFERDPGASVETPGSAVDAGFDIAELRDKVRNIYEQVALEPGGDYHFETGRRLAERLGYGSDLLDRVPAEAIDSFAGVGHHFGLAGLAPGETVVDLGSGSGMDALIAALVVGAEGRVIGVDMTDRQLEKAERLRRRHGFIRLDFRRGYIEEIPVGDEQADVVISNGVINLSPRKERVFQEVARILKPGGRLAISDIVSEVRLTPNITCDSSLWAACIGGAAQKDDYLAMIERAGLEVVEVVENGEYEFLSRSARNAGEEFGVKSVSLLALKALESRA